MLLMHVPKPLEAEFTSNSHRSGARKNREKSKYLRKFQRGILSIYRDLQWARHGVGKSTENRVFCSETAISTSLKSEFNFPFNPRKTSFSYVSGSLANVTQHNAELESFSRDSPLKYKKLVDFCKTVEGCDVVKYVCCKKAFTNLRNFNVHLTKLHRNIQEDIDSGKWLSVALCNCFSFLGNVFRCSRCPNRVYRSNFALSRHYREYHNSKMPAEEMSRNAALERKGL